MSTSVIWVTVVIVMIALWLVERYTGVDTTRKGRIEQCKYSARFVADFRYANPHDKVATVKIRLDDNSLHRAKVELGSYKPAIGDCVIVNARTGALCPERLYVTSLNLYATTEV